MVQGKLTQLNTFLNLLSKKNMNFEFYQEVSYLFKVYSVIINGCSKKFYNYISIKLIRDIAYTFELNLSIEDLLNIYPMAFEKHVYFFLVNELQYNTKYKKLLSTQFSKTYIQCNEWLDEDWKRLNELMNFVSCGKQFPLIVEKENLNTYIEKLMASESYSSPILKLWLSMFKEEVQLHGSSRKSSS